MRFRTQSTMCYRTIAKESEWELSQGPRRKQTSAQLRTLNAFLRSSSSLLIANFTVRIQRLVDTLGSPVTDILLLCDHELDPRLERRVSWLKKIFNSVVAITDSSRVIHGERKYEGDVTYLPYSEVADQIGRLTREDLLYVAGNRILQDHFRLLVSTRKKCPIIWEVADLPLRKGFPRDAVLGALFRWGLGRVSPNFVVTAPGFMRWLPSGEEWHLSENVPTLELAHELAHLEPVQVEGSRKLRIGFPGVIRFLEPLVMLHQFMCENQGLLELHIWGGSQDAWETLAKRFRGNSRELTDVYFHGPYTQRTDGAGIYRQLDIVWAVYDAKQINVRYALPNRLYEAVLAGRWFLAAEGTDLLKRVQSLKVGFGIPSHPSQYPAFRSAMHNAIAKVRSKPFPNEARQATLDLTANSERRFAEFVREVVSR